MADFQTNQQKKDLVRSEFVKSCNTVNGTISFEQTKSILKTIGFDISSIKIEKLVIDQDVDGLNQIDFEGILNILNNLLATNKSEDNDDESGSVVSFIFNLFLDKVLKYRCKKSINTISKSIVRILGANLSKVRFLL
ncbi:unnamed protein product [Rotaria magnacalcarata]|uniref:EF-hand domain-containing protein n=1 Tax=Rotaria magnacalcarata TaxID=392030 RepID=A0A816B824_9BILA|nr:unnamed protein product [Rotaria magnacalcarata]